MKIEIAAARLEALGNPTRLQIYRLLVRAGWDGLPVGTVQGKLRLPGSTLSHHLRRLIEAELVTQHRQATTLLCKANYETMDAVVGYLFAECCADSSCAPRPRGRRFRQTA